MCIMQVDIGTLTRISKVKPVLLSIWGSDVYSFPDKSKMNAKIFKKNILNATCITSTSNAMSEELKRKVDVKDIPIFITPFGVDIEKFNVKEKKEKEEFIIGNVKTLEPKYGIEYAILAVKKLKEKLVKDNEEKLANSIKLYIYGEGKLRGELEKLIRVNNLQETAFLKGRIPNDEVPIALNNMDVFCITSNSESFGVSVVEAMACEVPVIATKVDGFMEVMEDGKTGILVEKKNVEEITQALEKLLKNSLDRKEYGKNGRERVIKYYNWKNNVETMENIYINIVEKEMKKGEIK